MIDYKDLLTIRSDDEEYRWTDSDVILYALGIGMGRDPGDEAELPYVYEKDLRVVPTFMTVAAWSARPPVAKMGINYLRLVHGEQGTKIHRSIPIQGTVIASGRVTGAVDKGAKGAIIFTETIIRDAIDQQPIATLTSSLFARDEGDFGGPTETPANPHRHPTRDPDQIVEFVTREDQALLYRLTGDRNALHADPGVARNAGFERPILHGLCTYGITCRAVLQYCADFRPERIVSHNARFSSPIFPGETIVVHLWQDNDIISFEAVSKERDIAVITNGRSILR
jgi:acyl dehydratase